MATDIISTENFVKFRQIIFDICEQTDRQTDTPIAILCVPTDGEVWRYSVQKSITSVYQLQSLNCPKSAMHYMQCTIFSRIAFALSTQPYAPPNIYWHILFELCLGIDSMVNIDFYWVKCACVSYAKFYARS